MDVDVGGAVLVLPDDAPPEAVKRAVEHFRTTPEFDRLIDKESGAPIRVRGIVGSAPVKDKLRNLEQFYPDAVPYGDDNFVFTDPGTGRPTLFNPEGLDVGDVAGVAREGAQAVGGTLGAAGGVLLSAATGPGAPAAVIPATVAGAGLGTAAGGSLFDISMELFTDRIDTRTIGERLVDTTLDFGAGAIGQRFGELIDEGVSAATAFVKEKGGQASKAAARALVEAFDSLGIDPPAGAVSGSRAILTVGKSLEAAPASSDIMQRQAERILAQTKTAAEKVANEFGKARTKQGAGEVIKTAAKKAAERFGFRQEALYDEAFDLVGADTPVVVNAVKELREAMENELARAPRALGRALNSGLKILREIELDAASPDGLAFGALRQVRTMIGRDIDSPMLAGSTGSQNEALKRIYGALTDDMSAAARAAGPAAAKRLAVADRFTRQFMNTASKTMQKIADFEADERAFAFAMQSARDGGSALTRLRRHFTPEEWDTVAGTVLNNLGKATPGAQDAAGEAFSVNTFLTNWNRLAPEAKKALFGGKRYADLAPELDKLVRVIGSLKELEKVTNTSNTARNLMAYGAINSFGAALGGFVGGDVESAGGGALVTLFGTIVAPRVAARLITSPAFVKWLTTPVKNANSLATHVSRLSAIAVANPEIREEIEQFSQALRSLPAPGDKDQESAPEDPPANTPG